MVDLDSDEKRVPAGPPEGTNVIIIMIITILLLLLLIVSPIIIDIKGGGLLKGGLRFYGFSLISVSPLVFRLLCSTFPEAASEPEGCEALAEAAEEGGDKPTSYYIT